MHSDINEILLGNISENSLSDKFNVDLSDTIEELHDLSGIIVPSNEVSYEENLSDSFGNEKQNYDPGIILRDLRVKKR